MAHAKAASAVGRNYRQRLVRAVVKAKQAQRARIAGLAVVRRIAAIDHDGGTARPRHAYLMRVRAAVNGLRLRHRGVQCTVTVDRMHRDAACGQVVSA